MIIIFKQLKFVADLLLPIFIQIKIFCIGFLADLLLFLLINKLNKTACYKKKIIINYTQINIL